MIEFHPHPEIALARESFDPKVHKTFYRYNYEQIFQDIADGKLDQRSTFRWLLLNDLFFMVMFGQEFEGSNHPFVVERCAEIQDGARTDTEDIWARYHFKSSIVTVCETLQYHLNNPEHCTAILAYARPAAKKFIRSIKILCEQSDTLKWCFPDILWERPESQAPKWSEDDGLVFKRKSAARGESTIEGWGLTEGMPTGRHYERKVFDDLETMDIKDSPDMLDKVFRNFQMAANLGTGKDTDITRIVGTYYSHFGPMVRIDHMTYEDGRKMYLKRIHTASSDGTRSGVPVLMDKNEWEKAKQMEDFNSQQLCNPTPLTELRLDKNLLKPIDPNKIPHDIYKFMVLDQAGGDETEKQSLDLWSYCVLGIEPFIDDIGQSNVYILDVEADKMSHSEGINGVVTMYLRNGIIQQLGVEKVGLSTTEIHISNALRVKGRRLSLAGKNLVLLKPAGRSKQKRVESALQWPLNNGKLFYSTDIPRKYIDAIFEELDKFPFYHVDIIDGIAYGYDMFKEFTFQPYHEEDEEEIYYEPQMGRSAIAGY